MTLTRQLLATAATALLLGTGAVVSLEAAHLAAQTSTLAPPAAYQAATATLFALNPLTGAVFSVRVP